ncbi:unnamed protein product [Adineta steineri]|uniref:G domain-containing protein n=1 Tax=Adineta steineri TaxID=433720 RepID=A0A815IR56_9BILA|nr:unnamed protein product [Adineta steineri]CAF3695173.1 unnamed protein product [Adineta steineri]
MTDDQSVINSDENLSNDNKVVIFLGRTGSGKTSLFNLLSNSNQRLGNSVSSTTKIFFTKSSHDTTFIDTIGFRDTENENEHKLKVILFLKEIRNGFDIIFYCIRMDVFTSDEENLFSEIYETVLTKKAYNNSCLLITFYTRPDIDEVNTLNSPERQRLLDEFRCNPKYNTILDYFENRIFFVDIRQEENFTDYSFGSTKYIQYQTLNDMINERKQIVYKHLNKFIEYFFPERFDCENMKTLRDIIYKNDLLEKQLNELKEIISDIANERSTTSFYELLRFMPITNMFIDVFEISQRQKLEKRINKVLKH